MTVKQTFDVSYEEKHVLPITLTVFLSYSSVPVNFDSVTASLCDKYQGPETEAGKLNSSIIHFSINTFAFPAVTCQTILSKKQKLCKEYK